MQQRMIILEEGDRIHLKSLQGMYTVVKTEQNGLYISCKAWIARANHPEIIPTKFISYSDVKCLAGGFNNRREFSMYPIRYCGHTLMIEA